MSSTVSVTPFKLDVRPSRRLARYVLGVHILAGLVVITLPVAPWILILLLYAILLSCLATYQTHVSLRSRRAVVALHRFADGSWQLRFSNDLTHRAELLPDSYLHPELLVLNFRLRNGRRCSVVLVRDSAYRTSLRRLRVALALGRLDAEE